MFTSSSKIKLFIFIICLLSIFSLLYFIKRPQSELISLFPIQNYDQNISYWVKPTDADYDIPLITSKQQKQRYDEWYAHYYGANSPWNQEYIQAIYAKSAPQDLKSNEEEKINFYSNKNKSADEIGYGSNFRPYTNQWIDKIETKINPKQFTNQHYDSSKRAIAINNIQARQLPTHEVHFYNHKRAGQGFPFDNLQASVIWAGTPLYILGETLDHDWSLVIAPSFSAWVKNTDIAKVDVKFVNEWTQQARKNMIAVTQTHLPISDKENNLYRFTAYIGTTLPGQIVKNKVRVLIPVSDEKQHAHVHHAYLSQEQATLLPLQATPHHFANIMKQLIGRTYGWGSMYFYNDCASELKNLYTPFGIWLPIHSSDQIREDLHLIKTVDLSAKNIDERLAYLIQHGHKFMTIIYIGGHVILYVGSYPNPNDPKHTNIALSYQDMWGLKPKSGHDKRAIVGKSVLIPLLKKYPEDSTLDSHANKKYFQLGYLDNDLDTSTKTNKQIDINSLLSP